MRGRALPFVVLLLLSGRAYAQVTWQPTPPPLVTAENEAWYHAGAAIEWNGDFYYPAGAAEAFNAYQMVRAGSYRGIPLYTDATLEPYSIVFVPIGGGRMQPYERPRTGMLAGSVGSRAPLLPTATPGAVTVTPEGYVAQAPAPPTFARAYDLGPAAAPPQPISPAVPIVGTTGTVPSRVATRVMAPGAPASRSRGTATVWLDYGGRRWTAAGSAQERTADMTVVGHYRGFPVYQRGGDTTTIYIASVPALLVPYRRP